MVSVLEATAPSSADRLPPKPERGVVFRVGEVFTVLEQEQVKGETALVLGLRISIALPHTEVAVEAGVAESVTKGSLVAQLMRFLDQLS